MVRTSKVARTKALADGRRGGPWLRAVRGHPVLSALALSALILAATADERTFGLATDGQIVTRTAYSIAAQGELGMAQGHLVTVVRPAGDAVSRYGIGPSIVQVPAAALADVFERSFGPGSSQTLFVLGQLLWVLAAAGASGVLARAWGASPEGVAKAVLATAIASPLWGYVSSDFSEPLQAALVGGAFALAATAAGAQPGARRDILSVGAGAMAGFGLLSKSILIVLLPFSAAVLSAGGRGGRVRRLLLGAAGWAAFAGLWLSFEVVRFGRPFASYKGEHFNHPPLDGLWRLLVGPNKGLLIYFPLALLLPVGVRFLFRTSRLQAVSSVGFLSFILLTTSAWWSWDGTAGWGPRLLVPLVPLLATFAVLGAAQLRPAVFWVLFGAGCGVNLVGALQPDALTTWYYSVLPRKVLTEAEAARYPDFAWKRDAGGLPGLFPVHHVHENAAFSPPRVGLFLLEARLFSRDPVAALRRPPWRTDISGQELAVSPEQAIPESALLFFKAGFRWPHLGMSLFRPAVERDTALAFLDCLYDQALRGQDMRRADRAIEFGAKVYERMPGPQAAVAYMEGLRLGGRHEALLAFGRDLPVEWRRSPEFAMVLALSARDQGDAEKAKRFLARVITAAPRPVFVALVDKKPGDWPSTLRDVLRTEVR